MKKLFKTVTKVSTRGFKIGKLDHVGIAVPNLEESSKFYRDVLGADVKEEVQNFSEHGVSVVFVHLENTKIELLHPYGNDSPIENFLEKNTSGGIHHICYQVDDLDEAIKQFEKHEVRVLGEPKIGAHGERVVFLHPKDSNGVLIEIEEIHK